MKKVRRSGLMHSLHARLINEIYTKARDEKRKKEREEYEKTINSNMFKGIYKEIENKIIEKAEEGDFEIKIGLYEYDIDNNILMKYFISKGYSTKTDHDCGLLTVDWSYISNMRV
jgi:hypothetical protein